ncbi:MAG: leucine-rich repeat domain-containing protein [Treponemataceae bacterium]
MGQPTELGKTVDDMVASLIAHPEKKKLLNPIPISSFEYDIAKDSKGVIIKAYKGSVPAIVKIPETIEGIKVTEIIISNAFNNAQILVFPDTVNRIGGAMNGQKLKLILFPKNIKQIDAAFKYLQPSMNLILPEKLEVITYESFYGINIDTLTIPDSVTEIERYAFQYGKIGKLKLPNKLIKIGRSAFEKCQIKNLRLPNGLKVIGDYSFADNPFVNLVIPESVEVIGSGAFVACENLENVTVSNKKIKHSSTSPYPSDSTYSTFWYCPPFYKCPSLSMKSKQAIRVTGYTYDF